MKYTEVQIDNIEQGNFLKNAEKAFAEIQESIIRFTKENKVDATATLTLKIGIESNKAGGFMIMTDIDKKSPKKQNITVALAAEETLEGEQMRLFCQASGTNDGNPAQGLLATNDGTPIDQGTGLPKK
jgi:hypothetical protein